MKKKKWIRLQEDELVDEIKREMWRPFLNKERQQNKWDKLIQKCETSNQ